MRFRHLAAAGLVLGLAACQPPLKEYAYPAWGFAASFPASPKVTDQPASADGTSPHSLIVETTVAGRDFAATAADASASDKTPDQILADAPPLVAKGLGGEVTSTTYVATGGVTGREVRFSKDGKPFMVMREYVAQGHLYEIGATSILSLDDPAVKAFLNSFKLIPVSPAANAAPAANAS